MDAKEFFEDGFPHPECGGCEHYECLLDVDAMEEHYCHIADVSQCPAYLKSLDGGE
jgi:hypothetical protein